MGGRYPDVATSCLFLPRCLPRAGTLIRRASRVGCRAGYRRWATGGPDLGTEHRCPSDSAFLQSRGVLSPLTSRGSLMSHQLYEYELFHARRLDLEREVARGRLAVVARGCAGPAPPSVFRRLVLLL